MQFEVYIAITNEGINTVDHETTLMRIINVLMDRESNIPCEEGDKFLNSGIVGKTCNGSVGMCGEGMSNSSKV